MPNLDLEKFLTKIAQIESSGGLQTEHQKILKGLHKGSQAIGSYGLMPLTVQDIAKRKMLKGEQSKEYKDLLSQDIQNYKQYLKDKPEVEQQLAQDLAQRLLEKHGGNELKAAYAWNMGSNIPSSSITEDKLLKSPYIEKFKRLQPMLSSESLPNISGIAPSPLPVTTEPIEQKEQILTQLNKILTNRLE